MNPLIKRAFSHLANGFFTSNFSKWISENVSPGSEGGLSRLYPRVWTFSLQLTKPFVYEVRRKLSQKGSDQIQDDRWYDGLLDKLVIDEYLNRLRVHRWTATGEHQMYEMFDIDKSLSGRYWDFDKSNGCTVWSYSTDEMNRGQLTLSCSWERDLVRKEPYLQLVLWLHYWRYWRDKENHEMKEYGETNEILFKLPLEPRRLKDNAGQKVYVQGQGGREFKAGDLEFYPYDEDDWQSPEEEKERWKWYLRMKTFHDY